MKLYEVNPRVFVNVSEITALTIARSERDTWVTRYRE